MINFYLNNNLFIKNDEIKLYTNLINISECIIIINIIKVCKNYININSIKKKIIKKKNNKKFIC